MSADELRATARACANIALIKYWGARDHDRNLPLNDSISLTLAGAETVTTVAYDPDLAVDEIYLDGERLLDHRAARVVRHLDRIRAAYYPWRARVASVNGFPASTGLASSASGFAALTAAAIAAFGEGLPPRGELAAWARLGSGSAARSVPGGFVLLRAAEDHDASTAASLFPETHWDLRDLCVIVSTEAKEIPSERGHRLAAAHPFMRARQRLLPGRLAAVQAAVAARDMDALGPLVEQEAMEVQALMLSSTPSCLYMTPGTVAFLRAVPRWRAEGLPVYLTLDAGPNPHLLCEAGVEADVLERIRELAPQTKVLRCRPGPGVTLVREHLL